MTTKTVKLERLVEVQNYVEESLNLAFGAKMALKDLPQETANRAAAIAAVIDAAISQIGYASDALGDEIAKGEAA